MTYILVIIFPLISGPYPFNHSEHSSLENCQKAFTEVLKKNSIPPQAGLCVKTDDQNA